MSDIIFKTLLVKGENGGNIKDIKKTSTNGLVDTYTVTLTNGDTTTFNVTNGKNITSIKKTGSAGLVDTYTIVYNDGATSSTFTVTNGMNADGREVLRTVPNIEVEENTDINSSKYLNIGTYVCDTQAKAKTISNLPIEEAFCMYVIAMLGGAYGSEISSTWTYRMRIFISTSGGIYIQLASSAETPGVFTYSDWKKLVRSDELIAITNSDIDTILNS